MRVLELSQRYPPALGGVEATLGELVGELSAAGVEVEVATTDLARDRPFALGRFEDRASKVPIHRFRAIRWAPFPLGLGIAAPGMYFAAVGARADVLHAHGFGYAPTWVGAAVRHWRRTPLVITPHADPGRGKTFSELYHRTLARLTLRVADRVIFQSRVEREFLLGRGVPAEALVEIPTGIDLTPFAVPRPPHEEGPLRLLTVGRLDPVQKGLATLIEALALLPRDLDWSAELLGDDWGAASELLTLSAQRGIADRVHIECSPPPARILGALRSADLFVLPSRFESFPRVLLEAMAAGLPIVSTRVGGVPEMVGEGAAAVLVAPGDASGLTEAIVRLAGEPSKRARFGAEGKRRVESYSWPRLIPRYVALFRELTA